MFPLLCIWPTRTLIHLVGYGYCLNTKLTWNTFIVWFLPHYAVMSHQVYVCMQLMKLNIIWLNISRPRFTIFMECIFSLGTESCYACIGCITALNFITNAASIFLISCPFLKTSGFKWVNFIMYFDLHLL